MTLTRRDRRTVLLICALDGCTLLALVLLAALTPYRLHLEHVAMVLCWWVGALMSYTYTRRHQQLPT